MAIQGTHLMACSDLIVPGHRLLELPDHGEEILFHDLDDVLLPFLNILLGNPLAWFEQDPQRSIGANQAIESPAHRLASVVLRSDSGQLVLTDEIEGWELGDHQRSPNPTVSTATAAASCLFSM